MTVSRIAGGDGIYGMASLTEWLNLASSLLRAKSSIIVVNVTISAEAVGAVKLGLGALRLCQGTISSFGLHFILLIIFNFNFSQLTLTEHKW